MEPFYEAFIPGEAGHVAGFLYVSRIGHALVLKARWVSEATAKLDTFQKMFSLIQEDTDREVFLRDEWEHPAQDPAYLFAVASLITDSWWSPGRQLQWAMRPDEDWVAIVSHLFLDGRTTPLHELRERVTTAVLPGDPVPIPPFQELLALPRRQSPFSL